jgi:cytochrome bd ubiquinol oxidase subunit I
MVGIGVLMLCVAATGQVLRLRGRLWDARWFLKLCTWVAPSASLP